MDILQAGQTLGPYRIISQVGQGGMATVYKAYHAAMDRYVAVKVLPRQLAESPEFIGRFQQEARTIARLEHAHILPVHDYGESDGITYLVMRFLDAGTLKERLAAGELSLAETDRLFSQLADALEYAHSQGIVHRDLKPSNVLLDARGDLFLTDFGIAKLLESNVQFTSTGGLIGTPAYMSPEQAQGQKVDQRSDIYSLGIILYEMVTGRVPFEAETPLAVVLKHLNEPLPLPSTLKPGLSPAIERVILKALAKTPDDRYAATAEFLAAWKQAVSEAAAGGETMRAAAPAAQTVAAAPTMAAPAREAHPAAPSAARRLPLGWILGCAGALGLVLAAIVAVVAFLGPVVGNVTTPITTAPPTPGAAATQPGAQATAAGDTGGPAANGGAWTSWTAANIVTTLAVTEDKIYAGGWGGVTVWSLADGTVLQRITTGDGLPDTYVNALLVDEEDETLWVGTGFGLAAFDGERWTIYDADDGLDSDYVSALAWVDEGLLVGTQYSGRDGGGLNLLTDAGWQPVPGFPSADADQQPDKLSYQVNLILEADGVWWVGTQNGLGRFDGQAWTRFSAADGLPGDYITALMLDDDDALWVAAQGETAGVARFDGERFAPVERLQDFYVYGMIQDSRGDYWFAGGGGLARFHPDRRDWEFYDSSRFPAYSLIGAAEDEADNLYFGSDGGGLVRYDGSNFRAWAVPNVPGVAAYGRILRAPNGQLLFTQEYGSFVDRLDPDTETWSPATDLPCDYCAPLAFDAEGRLWAGGDLGLWVIRGGGDALHLTTESGLPADLVTSVAFEQDVRRAWVGTEAGVARFDGQQVVDVLRADNAGLAGDFIQLVFAASDGSMWVAPEANLSRLRAGGAWQHFAAGDPFSYDVRVSDIAEDASGAIWVATAGDGVYRYAQGNWQRFHPDTRGVGLPSPDVNCLTVAPDGSLWFGAYYSGAAHFDGNTWTTFGVGDGLIHSNVNDIYVDDAGTVWFATSGGVTRYRP